MREYIPFAIMEQLLLTTISLPGSTIKSIAAATGIQANTLYKWKTTPNHLSPEKADRLLELYYGRNNHDGTQRKEPYPEKVPDLIQFQVWYFFFMLE